MKNFSVTRKSNDLLFISGQLPIDEDNSLQISDCYEETMLCLKNLEKILIENNLSKDNIVKVTVFTTELSGLADINKGFNDFFEAAYPTRSLFEVSGIVGGAAVEIEAIASL
ncbi:RidA family protein [Vagococcus silagei]|uniref:RidA family protein n=1 Tax=Vagococcus silagei TaxID=2508885 RepID=A0A4S3B3M7_9ENTE|nr:RidA family protein [Vagococcus silagei]THB60370.1 RidA family protein [Vagococcus silagei]